MLEHSHQKDLFTMQDLKTLAEFKGSPCVSIYLPTHKLGQKRQEYLIRFENAIKTASGYLENLQVSKQVAESILEPAIKLRDDHFFLKSASDGLVTTSTSPTAAAAKPPINALDAMFLPRGRR